MSSIFVELSVPRSAHTFHNRARYDQLFKYYHPSYVTHNEQLGPSPCQLTSRSGPPLKVLPTKSFQFRDVTELPKLPKPSRSGKPLFAEMYTTSFPRINVAAICCYNYFRLSCARRRQSIRRGCRRGCPPRQDTPRNAARTCRRHRYYSITESGFRFFFVACT